MKQKYKMPKKWQTIKLNNLFETIPNLSNAREDLTDIAQKVMYIHYGDIHTNSICEKTDLKKDTLPYLLDSKIEKNIDDMFLKNGDVIITDASEDYEGIAKSVEITNINNEKVVAGLHTIVLRPIKNIVAIGYGSYLLQMPITSKKLKSISQGTKVISISFQLIKDLDIFLPPIKEQEKIVEILELWDKAIETTKKLIEQKKLQKKYLMQKLLTGKIRLKGFNDKWKNNLLQDLLFEENKRNHKNLVEKVFSITKSRGFVESSEYFSKEVASKDISNYKIVNFGNFAYNPARLNIGSIAKLKINDKVVVSPMYVVFSINTKLLNSNWFEFFIGTYEFNKKVNLSSQGSVRKTVDFSIFKKNKILLPTIKEQKAIADILLTVDKQIDLLEQKLSNLELQKKGLMQKLLTGEIRVC